MNLPDVPIRPTDEVNRPDWVMIGGAVPGGIRIYASRELTAANLEEIRAEQDADIRDIPPHETWRASYVHYRLTATVQTFVIVEAEDYAAAFAALFREWQPTERNHTALERSQAR